MTKHSKNNTASSIFTYAERKKTEYGQKRQRLGNESMRRFDACSLCLQHAREPLACGSGHLFCKECIYTDLLSQKKEIKRHKEQLEAIRIQEEEEKERAKEAARQRVLEDFEKGQLGLGAVHIERKKKAIDDNNTQVRGTKRKFDFDLEKAEIAAREAEEAALRQIEKEQAEARKAKLPDFWLPSLTPTAAAGPLKDIKPTTLCRTGAPSHSLILKDLIPVSFSTLEDGKSSSSRPEEDTKICPSCKKNLSNNLLIFLMKPCSHVVCKTCVDELVTPSKQCGICDKQLKKSDIIELKREGTGYAGGGMAESTKTGVAFQC